LYRIPEYEPNRFEEITGAPDSFLESLNAPSSLYPDDFVANHTEMFNYPINSPTQVNFKGIEINWQTHFWYLPGLLRGLVLDINYSWIHSAAWFPYLLIEEDGFDPGPPPRVKYTTNYYTKKSRMLDQPNSLFNARIGWDYKNFSSRLSFRFQGETVRSLDPVLNITDSFLDDEFRMDFTAKQKITDRLSIMLDLSNITEFIEDSHLNSHNLLRSSEFYGFTSQLGLRYEY